MNFLSGLSDDGDPRRAIGPAPLTVIRPAPAAHFNRLIYGPIPEAQRPEYATAPSRRIRLQEGVFGGFGDDSTPISRMIGPELIGPPSATTMAFPVPGAGMPAKSLGPKLIGAGPSGEIVSLQARLRDPQEALLQQVRNNIQPLIDSIAALSPGERGVAVRQAMAVLEFPGAADAIEKHALIYISHGTPAAIAFREALVRVVSLNIQLATRKVLDTQSGRIAASGLYGLGLYATDLDGLGGFFSGLKKVAKTIAKGTTLVVKGIAAVTKAVACSSITKGVVVAAASLKGGKPEAGLAVSKAACGAAKIQSKVAGVLDKAVSGKKKKKKRASGAAEPAAEPASKPASKSARNLMSSAPAAAEPAAVEAAPGMSMPVKIGIGLGAAVVLGGGAYMMSRKKG